MIKGLSIVVSFTVAVIFYVLLESPPDIGAPFTSNDVAVISRSPFVFTLNVAVFESNLLVSFNASEVPFIQAIVKDLSFTRYLVESN